MKVSAPHPEKRRKHNIFYQQPFSVHAIVFFFFFSDYPIYESDELYTDSEDETAAETKPFYTARFKLRACELRGYEAYMRFKHPLLTVRPVCEVIGVSRLRLEKWCEFEHHGGSHGRLNMKLRYLETWRAYTRVICFILRLRNNARKRKSFFPIFQWNVGKKRDIEEVNFFF